MFLIDSLFKINSRTYKIKYLNGEIMIERFYEKELLLTKIYMSYYPDLGSHITDKAKVVLELSN